MFCNNCGKDNLPNSASCAYCGAQMSPQPPPTNQNYGGGGWEKPKTSGMAIAALVLGILSLFTCGLTMPFGIIFGIVALVQINKSSGRVGGQGMAIAGIVVSAFAVVLVLPAILFPVFARARDAARKTSCQSNLRELALSTQMYSGDYDGMFPSSALVAGSPSWSSGNFKTFGAGAPNSRSWSDALAKYIKHKGSLKCPSDSQSAAGMSSYFWKAAVDRAWYGGARKEGNYPNPNATVLLYEHNGWHWGQESQGLSNGVTINCAFMDGHVMPVTIKNSGYWPTENPPSPLPTSGTGEPAWFNMDLRTGVTSIAANWNPKQFCDDLPSRVSGRYAPAQPYNTNPYGRMPSSTPPSRRSSP